MGSDLGVVPNGKLGLRRAAWGLVACTSGSVAWLAVVTWLAAFSWLGVVFPGFLVVTSGHTGAVVLADWPGQGAGIAPYWRVVAADGRPTASGAEVYAVAALRPAGTAVRWTFETPAGARFERSVATATFGGWDLVRVFMVYWVSALAHVALGALVLLLRPHDRAAWAHWWLCLALGVFMLANFDVASTFLLAPWLPMAAVACVAPAVVALATTFPIALYTPRARGLLLGALLAWAAALTACVASGHPGALAFGAWGVVLTASAALLAAIALWARLAWSAAAAAHVRAQARAVMVGLAVAFVPAMAASVLAPLLGAGTPGLDLAHSAFVAFPLAVAWAIVRHGAFEVPPLVAALRGWLDRTLYGELEAILAELDAFARRPAVATGDVANEVLGLATRLVGPGWSAVWVAGARVAARGPAPACVDEAGAAGVLRVRVPLGEEADAWLALGPRAEGPAYRVADRAAVEVLAAHAGTALGRARLVEERVTLRIRESVARALAEERDRMLRQVLHDLKTEVFNVGLAAELGQRHGEADEALVRIERSAERMSDFLREKARQVVDGRTGGRTALGPVLEGVREAMAAPLATRAQSLAFTIEDADAAVPLTAVELGQILLNLLENASKFSPPGAPIRVEARREGGQLMLAVVDQGPGLPVDWAYGRRTDPSAPGFGLGLRNVELLAVAVGGTVAWRNGAGGAVFEVRLPLLAREPGPVLH